MSRIMLIGLFASAFLIASALISPAIEMAAGPILSSAAHAATNLNSGHSNIYRKKTSKKGGRRAGRACG